MLHRTAKRMAASVAVVTAAPLIAFAVAQPAQAAQAAAIPTTIAYCNTGGAAVTIGGGLLSLVVPVGACVEVDTSLISALLGLVGITSLPVDLDGLSLSVCADATLGVGGLINAALSDCQALTVS